MKIIYKSNLTGYLIFYSLQAVVVVDLVEVEVDLAEAVEVRNNIY